VKQDKEPPCKSSSQTYNNLFKS